MFCFVSFINCLNATRSDSDCFCDNLNSCCFICSCCCSCCSCCFCCSCCSCNTLLRAATEAANIESRFNLASVALTTARSLRKRRKAVWFSRNLPIACNFEFDSSRDVDIVFVYFNSILIAVRSVSQCQVSLIWW